MGQHNTNDVSKPKRNPLGFSNAKSAFSKKQQLSRLRIDYRMQEQQALALISQGKLQEAEAIYRTLIAAGIQNDIVYRNLAAICGIRGGFDESIDLLRQALKLKPNNPEVHNNLGNAFKGKGDLNAAIASYNVALQLKSSYLQAHNNLGNAFREKGDLSAAIASYKAALQLKPNNPEVQNNLGIAFKEKGDFNAAIASYNAALQLNSNYPEAQYNLGNAFKEKGDLNAAITSYNAALKLKPSYLQAHNNLGIALKEKGDLSAAIASYNAALQLKSNYPEAHYNLGIVLAEQGDFNAAIASFEKAINLKKDLAISKAALMHCQAKVCDWSTYSRNCQWLETLGIEGEAVAPWGLLALEDEPEKHLIRAQRYYEKEYLRTELTIYTSPKSRIRIGYFSADFFDHAIMQLISGIIELHDKQAFDIYAYDFGPAVNDCFSRRLKENVTVYRDIRDIDDMEAVSLARSDQIDIAVDLQGYTKNNRTRIFSYRVAPIQINYLGYPGSMGSKCIDYLIADRTLIPKGSEKYYGEKIIYMPHSYQCNDGSKEISTRIFTRDELGLPSQAFVFTCFNNNYKITSCEFDIWMRLLSKVDHSVLWLYRSNQWAEINLRKEAEKRCIDSSRLIFAEKMLLHEHLARHECGDLFLDTFNYNAHTTASDALWSGMPLLTMAGRSFSARVSASLLAALNLPELITTNEKEYEETAYMLASEPHKLSALKEKLARVKKSTPVFDSTGFTRDLEERYKEVIRINQEI